MEVRRGHVPEVFSTGWEQSSYKVKKPTEAFESERTSGTVDRVS